MTQTISFAPIARTLEVNAPPRRAFEIFTAFRWWPRSHSILQSRSPQVLVAIEPRIGGRWFERGEDGSECAWGEVIAWEPPGRLVMTWRLDGDFKIDPERHTEVEVTFTAIDTGRTRVVLEHRLFERFGPVGQKIRDAVGSPGGWADLLAAFAALIP
jgi:uncharacterized protein YndB with AHSA1/START domain